MTYAEASADPLYSNRLDRLEARDNRKALYECRCGRKAVHVAGVLRPHDLPPDGHPRTLTCPMPCSKTMVRVA